MMRAIVALCVCGLAVSAWGESPHPLQRPRSGELVQTPAKDDSLVAAPSVEGALGKGGVASEKLPQPYVASLETYGSDRINSVILKDFLGKDLDRWIEMGLAGDPRSLDLERQILEKIQKKFGFAQADWSIVQYFEPGDLAIHLTLDVVEKKDMKRRKPFDPAPTGKFADPDNLINQWMAYEDTALKLVETGALEPEAEKCQAFHCPFGHKHAKLKKYESLFVEGVNKHGKLLARIQEQDARPQFRAAASYLLAYHKDAKFVIQQMVGRVKDPDPLVRNNAMRVLGDIAEFHPEHIIPLRPLLPALDFPRVSDRSKAIYVVYLQVQNSAKSRTEVLENSVPDLIKMLGSKQPDHHDLAHGVLRRISGKDFSGEDIQSWKNWYTQYQRDSRSLTRRN